MKQTVFIKVMLKDRLPVSFGRYMSNMGYVYYHNGMKVFSTDQGHAQPKWFLEEIELPTEQELRKESLGKFSETEAQDEEIGDYIEDDAVQFIKGANYILNKIK